MNNIIHDILKDESIYEEMTHHLQNLIKYNTTNPPGNEIEAVQYISSEFEKENIPYFIEEPQKGRASIIARIDGNGKSKGLLLMSHLDVVPVEEDQWDHPPFSGDIIDDHVFGRGALDCKNLVVLWMMVMLTIKRRNIELQKDLIFCATADEECSGKMGMEWIVNNHFEKINAEVALNEGGGFFLQIGKKTFCTIQCAEKGILILKIKAKGTEGHAAALNDDNPINKISDVISKINSIKPSFRFTPTSKKMLRGIIKSFSRPFQLCLFVLNNRIILKRILYLFRKKIPLLNILIPIFQNTYSITMFNAGNKYNVVPSQAECIVDIRLLPGQKIDDIIKKVHKVVKNSHEIEVISRKTGNESKNNHPIVDSISKIMDKEFKCQLLPLQIPASTDGYHVRKKGIPVYGFSPLLPTEDISLIHRHNEKISLGSIRHSFRIGFQVVLDYCNGKCN